MDLDTRPPELQRSTIGMWVHECQVCGFVSGELGKSKPTDVETVAKSGYRAALASRDRHHSANRFVCRSMLDEAAGELASSGWRRLHAAWVCDDLLLADLARRSGEFERGIAYCETGLQHEEITPFVADLLRFERQLCEAKDMRCHTVGEIEENAVGEEPRGTVH
jgi:hypothetical protein